MATDSVLTTLLEQISVNLRDETNFAGLTQLKNNASYGTRYIAPVFVPLDHPTPYALICPGPCGKSGPEGRVDRQQVFVHVVHAVYQDAQDYYATVGDADTDGLLTLSEEVEAALVRPAPYRHAPYNTSPYTAITNISTCYALGWTAPEPADVEVAGIWLKQTLTVEYLIEKGQ